jgi:hypothetical protein
MFVTSNRTYYRNLKRYNTMGFSAQVHYWMSDDSVLADMDGGDTCKIQISPSGGGSVVDVYGTSTPQTNFWGYLLG